MDRRVKERLIGAGILVVLAVVAVPELLSGPKPAAPAAELPRLPAGAPDPVRNVTVDLATSKPAVASSAPAPPTPTAAAPPATTTAAAAARDAASSGGTAAPPAPAPTPAPAPSPETATPPPISAQSFAVQLGTFANRSNADKLVHQLKAQGFSIYMTAEGAGGAARYRVRVGPLSDRNSAERTVAKLKALRIAATIVAPRS
jgi:DedD protein